MILAATSFWLPDAAVLRLMLPELILVATAVAVLIAALLLGRDSRSSTIITIVGAIAAALAAANSLGALGAGPIEMFAVPGDAGQPGAPGVLVADSLGMFFRLLVAVFLVAIAAMASLLDRSWKSHAAEFLLLLLCSAVGMMFMASSINLLLMIIAIELTSMPSYALAGFDRSRKLSAEAAAKYMIFGAATTGFGVFGASLLFGLFGTLHVPTLALRIAEMSLGDPLSPLVGLALLATFSGVLFKISAVPLHFWCPDVFEGAPLPIATWLSVASKAAGVLLLLRLVNLLTAPLGGAAPSDVGALIVGGVALLSVITMFWSNLAAFRQTNVRRLLAYSSIAHAGYMLAAAAVLTTANFSNPAVISAVAQYILVYLFMNLGAFLCLGLVRADSDSEDLEAFTGLGWRDPVVAGAMTVCLLSLVGLPPLGGFVVKFWLIAGLAAAGHAYGPLDGWIQWGLVLAIVINTAISLYYYARIIRQMYLRGADQPAGGVQAPFAGKAAVAVCAIVLVLTGTLLIGPLKRTGDQVARASIVVPVARATAAR